MTVERARSSSAEKMTPAELDALAASLPRTCEEALARLPEDEQRRYRECQQSVIDARRAGERIATELWIG